MLNRVAKYIEENQMIKSGDLIIVGVSGGPDSIALLHILNRLSKELHFSIVCAHLNHCLREAANAEEQFVRDKCLLWKIPFYSRMVKVREAAASQKKSLEEMGRICRYRFFSELLTELKGQSIATAHHGDDVAETVLLHLLRGTGLKGLRGILPVSGQLIRPLLGVKKAELVSYLNDNGINYCWDQSNEEVVYTRNRIRNELIPYLQKNFNPRIIDSLNQLAVMAREENQVLDEETERLWQDIAVKEEKELIIIDSKLLMSVKSGYQRRLIKKALGMLAGEAEWDLEDTNMVMNLADREGSSRIIHLKKGVKVNKVYDQLIFTTLDRGITKFSYPVPIPGQVIVHQTHDKYEFDLVDRREFQPKDNEMYLDYDKITEPLVLRSRQNGDRFRPPGFKGHKKLKNYFIDQKVPLLERDKVPILASATTIYAILGFQVTAQATVSQDTRKIVVIKKENIDNNN
ncbi:MAG: tRNA lysidine(34) synthetase TilS [Syntrophomonadaceae bacterium]|jgi:tRNA(Ile)-lysidine synthase